MIKQASSSSFFLPERISGEASERERILHEICNTEATVFSDFIAHEIDLLEKKSANRKSTKTQTENVGIKINILEVLEGSDGMTVSQIMPFVGEGAYSNQKISSLLRQLVESGEVARHTEKRIAYFRLA